MVMDEQEQQLDELLKVLRQHPKDSPLWRRTMSRFLTILQGWPEFRKYAQPDRPSYLLDALNLTWTWVSRDIQNFEPRTESIRLDLIRWINGYLYWRIKDLVFKDKPEWPSIDQPISGDVGDGISTLLDLIDAEGNLVRPGTQAVPFSGLDKHIRQIQAEETRRKGLHVEIYIEQDPEQKLQSSYPRNHPECHSQLLAQRILLKNPPDKLSKIAREFNIDYQNLNYHWKRKTIPLLRTLLS
jgi:hypothetical protein